MSTYVNPDVNLILDFVTLSDLGELRRGVVRSRTKATREIVDAIHDQRLALTMTVVKTAERKMVQGFTTDRTTVGPLSPAMVRFWLLKVWNLATVHDRVLEDFDAARKELREARKDYTVRHFTEDTEDFQVIKAHRRLETATQGPVTLFTGDRHLSYYCQATGIPVQFFEPKDRRRSS